MDLLIDYWKAYQMTSDTFFTFGWSCRLLFWSDWGASDGQIQYSTLLGEEVKTLVDSNVVDPRGLAIDYASSRLVDHSSILFCC